MEKLEFAFVRKESSSRHSVLSVVEVFLLVVFLMDLRTRAFWGFGFVPSLFKD
jgi:hypothetical protein